MTSGNFEEIFQLIEDDVTKENTKLRELIWARLELSAANAFLWTGELYKCYVYTSEYYSSYSTMSSSRFTSFHAFVFSIFSSLSPL